MGWEENESLLTQPIFGILGSYLRHMEERWWDTSLADFTPFGSLLVENCGRTRRLWMEAYNHAVVFYRGKMRPPCGSEVWVNLLLADAIPVRLPISKQQRLLRHTLNMRRNPNNVPFSSGTRIRRTRVPWRLCAVCSCWRLSVSSVLVMYEHPTDLSPKIIDWYVVSWPSIRQPA
jgi:hypothetical protein